MVRLYTTFIRTKAFLIWGVISLSLRLALCGTSIMTLPEIKIENPTLENDFSIEMEPPRNIDWWWLDSFKEEQEGSKSRKALQLCSHEFDEVTWWNEYWWKYIKMLGEMFQRSTILKTQWTWFMLELLGDQTKSSFESHKNFPEAFQKGWTPFTGIRFARFSIYSIDSC